MLPDHILLHQLQNTLKTEVIKVQTISGEERIEPLSVDVFYKNFYRSLIESSDSIRLLVEINFNVFNSEEIQKIFIKVDTYAKEEMVFKIVDGVLAIIHIGISDLRMLIEFLNLRYGYIESDVRRINKFLSETINFNINTVNDFAKFLTNTFYVKLEIKKQETIGDGDYIFWLRGDLTVCDYLLDQINGFGYLEVGNSKNKHLINEDVLLEAAFKIKKKYIETYKMFREKITESCYLNDAIVKAMVENRINEDFLSMECSRLKNLLLSKEYIEKGIEFNEVIQDLINPVTSFVNKLPPESNNVLKALNYLHDEFGIVFLLSFSWHRRKEIPKEYTIKETENFLKSFDLVNFQLVIKPNYILTDVKDFIIDKLYWIHRQPLVVSAESLISVVGELNPTLFTEPKPIIIID